jgi:hypothetical protein
MRVNVFQHNDYFIEVGNCNFIPCYLQSFVSGTDLNVQFSKMH